MIKISDLSQEEIQYICAQISPRETRRFFQKSSREFGKIKGGFRAEKLSDDDTISILAQNSNKLFISSFIETSIKEWIKQVQENIHRLEEEGLSEGKALLKTMPDSAFCKKPELYFKVTEKDVDEDYITLFLDALSFAQKVAEGEEKADEENAVELLNEANATVDRLQSEIDHYHKTHTEIQKENDAMRSELEASGDREKDLNAKLQAAEAQLAEIQSELDHYKHLENYADEQFKQNDYQQFQHISIGRVYHDYSGQAQISRLADIEDGEIKLFIENDDEPPYFENRNHLFWKNGPEEDGVIGVWNWSATPRDTDASKDYIDSKYNQNAMLTEIVEIPYCRSVDELAEKIVQGIDKTFMSEKVLFVCTTGDCVKEGLLCSPGSLVYFGEKARLAKSVFMLPRYMVSSSDIVEIASTQIYRKLNLGIPQSVYRVRTPYDVIKEILLSKASITVLRENGWSKREAQRCRNFLNEIPTQSLVQELSDAYACTENEAEEYVNSFISNVDSYLTASDFDTRILSIALERNPSLIERCKEQLTDDWKAENVAIFEEAQKQLHSIQAEMSEKKRESEALNKQRDDLIENIQRLQKQIDDKQKLASDVEEKISARIEEAKCNAAEFISQMAFAMPASVPVTSSQNRKYESQPINVYRSSMINEAAGKIDDINSFEEGLTENFETIGYDEATAIELAQAVSFCMGNCIPVVVGENSVIIAQCVAASMNASKLVELYILNQDISIESLVTTIKSNCDTKYPQVILIHGIFDGYSIGLFNGMINQLGGKRSNTIIFLSIEGIPANMIPTGIWKHALYLDGDEGLQDISVGPVQSFEISLDFDCLVDKDVFGKKKKALSSYSHLITNAQAILYARYLSRYDTELKDSALIINQMIVTARSCGKEELLNSVFREQSIEDGERMLSKYL